LKIEGVDCIAITTPEVHIQVKKGENFFTNTINYKVSLVGKF
jgi:hypothetical protein